VYGWLWGKLPGPIYARIATAALLFALLVMVLFLWVFPWLEPRLPFTDVTVDGSVTSSAPRILGL